MNHQTFQESGCHVPVSTAESLHELLHHLSPRHKMALKWFADHAGTIQSWPEPLAALGSEKTFLATKAKGIYKPSWSEFALSVRQTMDGVYDDKPPVSRVDGTWVYKYFQENADPAKRDSQYTNVGLMACMREKIPVGVLRQVASKPRVQYLVLGLALVANWEDGHFYLEGFSQAGHAHAPGASAEIDQLTSEELEAAIEAGAFSSTGITDARRRVLAQIVRRQGQPAFREKLLNAYERKCAVTGCDAIAALEAAHITPYRGPETNHVGNGLLLRSDIHTLFDLGLIAVDEGALRVLIASGLRGTVYELLEGSPIRIPSLPPLGPFPGALRAHRVWAGL